MSDFSDLLAALAGQPRAMTLEHDRLVLRRADEGGGDVVLVRCPHTIGLCFEMEDGSLGLLPCPCNERSEIIAELVPRPDRQGCDCTELCSMGPTCPGGMLAGLPGSGCWRTRDTAPGAAPGGGA